MDRREALNKATVTTAGATAGLLDPTQATSFIRKIKEKGELSNLMRQEIRTSSAGEINKIATSGRIIRAATENADDGYRAGAAFDSVPYVTVKVRLPWEVTEDVFHENIAGEGLEGVLMDEMTSQFSLDLEDLDINGNTADVSADAPFLTIDDGLLKKIAASSATHKIAGGTISSGVWGKAHLFDALNAIPNRYRNQGDFRWIMSPARKLQWWESIVDRDPAAGDDLLLGNSRVLDSPLGIPTLSVPSMPDSTVLLAQPRNFVRVVSWQVRKRRVTGETDATLAAKDKRFYVFFLKRDVVIEEDDAVASVTGLAAP
jgi:hypothetical protein